MQIGGNVGLGATGQDGMAKDLPARLQHPAGSFWCVLMFQPTQAFQDVDRPHLSVTGSFPNQGSA